jgi:hypothetical protein
MSLSPGLEATGSGDSTLLARASSDFRRDHRAAENLSHSLAWRRELTFRSGTPFAFGLLLAYPLREMTLRRVHAHRLWAFTLPVLATLALSSSYEIVEWLAAQAVDPEIGMASVGAQGDMWDGQKDSAWHSSARSPRWA